MIGSIAYVALAVIVTALTVSGAGWPLGMLVALIMFAGWSVYSRL